MILYLVLIVFSGIVSFISLIFLILGLVKKRKGIIKSAAIVMVLGIISTLILSGIYAKKAIDYVHQKDFQDITKSGANYVGQTAGSIASGLSEGLSATLDETAIEKLAHKSANITGASIKAIAKGLDSSMSQKKIFINENLKDAGLEFGHAEVKSKLDSNFLAIYVDFKHDFHGNLVATNYDAAGKIIERSIKMVDEQEKTGKILSFKFVHADLGLTTYFIISKN